MLTNSYCSFFLPWIHVFTDGVTYFVLPQRNCFCIPGSSAILRTRMNSTGSKFIPDFAKLKYFLTRRLEMFREKPPTLSELPNVRNLCLEAQNRGLKEVT